MLQRLQALTAQVPIDDSEYRQITTYTTDIMGRGVISLSIKLSPQSMQALIAQASRDNHRQIQAMAYTTETTG
jgi:hypothetical protein